MAAHPSNKDRRQSESANFAKAQAAQVAALSTEGWYVYEDGQVTGPTSARAALQAPPTKGAAATPAERFVSRMGFSRWYSLGELADLLDVADKLGQSTVEALEKLEAEISRDLSTLETLKARALETERQERSRREANASVRVQGRVVGKAAQRSESAPYAPETRPVETKLPAATGYLVLKGRLRLGQVRDPWAGSLIFLPFTLGLYWCSWFYESAREITWHLDNSFESRRLPPLWLAIVPLLHIYMTYRLARAIAAAEAENAYRGVSAPLAALFALVPPFAVFYLQKALNRHWLLHVKHAVNSGLV